MARGLFVRQPVVVLLSSPLQLTLQPSAVAEATPNELVHAILHNGQPQNYTAKIMIISGNRNIQHKFFGNVSISFKTSCYVLWIQHNNDVLFPNTKLKTWFLSSTNDAIYFISEGFSAVTALFSPISAKLFFKLSFRFFHFRCEICNVCLLFIVAVWFRLPSLVISAISSILSQMT